MSRADDENTLERDSQVLETLERIEFMLQQLKRSPESGMYLLLHFYNKLPDDVAHRLSELDRETVEITTSTDPDTASAAIAKLNGSDSLAQIVRAENHYRQRLGYSLIGPDGMPEKGTSSSGDTVQM